MLRGSVHWLPREGGGRLFAALSVSGHSFAFDDAPSPRGFSPLEAVLLALAGSTGRDVLSILERKRQRVTGYQVRVEAEQQLAPPAVFAALRVCHVIRGCGIDPDVVSRAIELSHRKYDAVGAMLEKTTQIEHTFEIVEEGSGGATRPSGSTTTIAPRVG